MTAERDEARLLDHVIIKVDAADHEVELRWQLHDAVLAGARIVVVDVSELPCLSSNAMAALLGAHRACRARRGEVVLCGCSRASIDVLLRTGLHRIFRTERTLRAWVNGPTGTGSWPGTGELDHAAAS